MPKTPTPIRTELLTSDEVIERLLSDARLRRMAATCVLPAVRWGNDWRFRESDLDNWIQRQNFSHAAHELAKRLNPPVPRS